MSASGWPVTTLGRVAAIEMGQSPPSLSVSERPTAGLPFLQGNAEFTDRYPAPRLWCRSPVKRCSKGDLLVSVRAPVGATNEADQDLCIGRGLAAIRFIQMDPRFGAHAVRNGTAQLRRVSQGTTFEAVGSAELDAFALGNPSRAEQRRIAEILDALDDAIRATEQVIAKLEMMRQGLLIDLLTRGIDENGRVRLANPTTWTCRSIRTCLDAEFPGEWGGDPRGQGNALVIRSTELLDDCRLAAGTAVWRQVERSRLDAKRLRDGDVLLESSGGAPGRPVGRVAPFAAETASTYVCSNFLRTLRPNSSVVPRFLAWRLHLLWRDPAIMAFQQQTTGITNLKVSEYLLHELLLPPKPEQAHIVEVLDASEHDIRRRRLELGKLKSVRVGLCDDLLTGRVRVKAPGGGMA